MFSYGSVTNDGLKALTKASSGHKLTITRMAYGSGIYDEVKTCNSAEELNNFCSSVNSLKSKKADIKITGFKLNDTTYTISGITEQTSFTDPFRVYEMGVYAQIENEEEILLAYFTSIDYIGQVNDKSDYLDPSQLVGQSRKVTVPMTLGATENITINVIYDGDYIDEEKLDSKLNEVYAKINSIDYSHFMHFDVVVDSDESLLNWANTRDGSAKTVLIKSGTYTLNGRMINPINTGTKYIFGLPGAKIKINYQKGIGVGELSNAKFMIENVDIEVNDESEEDVFAIYYGAIAKNCNVVATSKNNAAYGFKGSTTENCTAVATGGSLGYGFYDCSFCTRSRAGGVSTTSTWGGNNTYIDDKTCDIND